MTIWIILCLMMVLDYSFLMIFYFVGWKRTPTAKATASFSENTHVSVIIAARNEEKNIERCIHSVLQQNYPAHLFEVIVVDDHSDDQTFFLAKNIPAKNLRVLKLSEQKISKNLSFKKQAIALGIDAASGELIVTTDADCVVQKNWLREIVAYYEKNAPAMIAGPVAFTNEKFFLEKWQSLDLCGMMAITAGAIRNGFPNMCNGANLAYPKKIFNDLNGFTDIDHQPSGDDVMLMMKIAKKFPGSIHFLKSKEAIVFTSPLADLQDLLQQRLRWLSKGTAFPDWRVSLVLVVSWLFNLSIIINFIGGFFNLEFMLIAAFSIAIKTLFELPLLFSGCSFFGKKKLLSYILPAQILHIIYVTVAGGLSRLGKFKWKGRSYG